MKHTVDLILNNVTIANRTYAITPPNPGSCRQCPFPSSTYGKKRKKETNKQT